MTYLMHLILASCIWYLQLKFILFADGTNGKEMKMISNDIISIEWWIDKTKYFGSESFKLF